jgi:hypothetical protein
MNKWPSAKEKTVRGSSISPQKKLEGMRLMNELQDKVLTLRQKLLRRKLRESL